MLEKLNSIIENKAELKRLASVLDHFLDIIEAEVKSNDFAFLTDTDIITKSEFLKQELSNSWALPKQYEYVELCPEEAKFVINSYLLKDNANIINLLLTIIKLLNESIITEQRSREAKLLLDSKIEQLSQLYELSKEFSGILDLDYVSKLLVYSIVGQFLVSKYAIIYIENDAKVLESRADDKDIKMLLNFDNSNLTTVRSGGEISPEVFNAGFRLILPMQIKNETKGIIFLGEKKNKEEYSKHDIEYLNSVGSLAIISIENAILFKQALEKKIIERDLETARTIQKNLLPHKILQPEGYEIAAYSESAKQVGGDYFDLLPSGNNETIFAMADVSGKGITASLLVANSQAYLKSISKQSLPIEVATAMLNDLVEESTVSGTYITFFWGRLNSRLQLTYVNAGHNPPLLIRNGKLKKLDKGGLILGIMKTLAPYESETIQLQKGDYIVAFTDGITEAMNSSEEEYTDERLERLCGTFRSESAEEVKSFILSDVKEFTAGYEQSDDLSLLVIKAV